MVNILGFDVGGVNTKAAYVETDGDLVVKGKTASQYFPIWKRSLDQLPVMLDGLLKQLRGPSRLDGVSLTMTAELSDAYRTKREGVNHILGSIEQILNGIEAKRQHDRALAVYRSSMNVLRASLGRS